jgi:hypothetical protein
LAGKSALGRIILGRPHVADPDPPGDENSEAHGDDKAASPKFGLEEGKQCKRCGEPFGRDVGHDAVLPLVLVGMRRWTGGVRIPASGRHFRFVVPPRRSAARQYRQGHSGPPRPGRLYDGTAPVSRERCLWSGQEVGSVDGADMTTRPPPIANFAGDLRRLARQGVRRFPWLRVLGWTALGLAAYGVLYGANEAVQHLEGEVAFAFVVVTVATWGLGRMIVALVTRVRPGVQARTLHLHEAAAMALLVLFCLPIAIRFWPASVLPALFGLAAAGVAWRAHVAKWAWVGCGLIVCLSVVVAYLAREARTENAAPIPQPFVPVAGAERLAERFRPVLMFDSKERFEPLDIEAAMAAGEVQVCRFGLRDSEEEAPCNRVDDPTGFDNSFDYLTIREHPLEEDEEPGGEDSAYYYRAVERDGRLYIDFWWFFALNPSPLERRGFCAPGFRLSDVTCFEHAADWEGVTVVLERCEDPVRNNCVGVVSGLYAPVAVHYAQHKGVKGYVWSGLLSRWRERGLHRPSGRQGPFVFVARNSHASYPAPGDGFTEGPYDGRRPWMNNVDCDRCLKQMPTTDDGQQPASWNAFTKPWGAQRCIIFGTYCDRSKAPTAPSTQKRYQDPTRAS